MEEKHCNTDHLFLYRPELDIQLHEFYISNYTEQLLFPLENLLSH